MHITLSTPLPPSPRTESRALPGAAQRLDTRNAQHYGRAHFDEIGDIYLAQAYSQSDRQIRLIEIFKLVATTGTGRAILADLRVLSNQGVRIAIGPRDDFDVASTHVPALGVSATVDGAVLWDCKLAEQGLGTSHPEPDAYKSLIWELAQLRNLAAERAWPGIPPLRSKDVEPAFMAELAIETAPAFAASRFCPAFPVWRTDANSSYLPEWKRGATYFDTLDMLMPAWLTDGGQAVREDVIVVLRQLQETVLGKRLLTDLWVYGRSRVMLLIHHSASGKDGVHKVGGNTPVWCFNKTALAGQAQSKDLTDREARASGAFAELLVARCGLAAKVGVLQQGADVLEAQKQFEAELIDARQRPRTPAAMRAPADPAARTVAEMPPQRPRALGMPVPDQPTAQVETPAPQQGWAAGQEDITRSPGAQAPASRDSRIAHWLQESARAFARSFGDRAASPARSLPGRSGVPNVYTRAPARSPSRGPGL